MRIRIVESARRDLDEGYTFYESQEKGLGDYFLSAVRADIESLRISGGVHQIVYCDYHRLLCNVFPFAVFYVKDDDEVTVYAVVDCRRDPVWIRRHISESSGPDA
ncbi:MAG TPA: type II toxin-antitoxin system RelE/ParE family toxin [Acidobacteriota bacterium]|nr:type II toxin-antitoxin system RelE/ParE family toxin [Acidobacteriota bacterium]